MTSRIRRQQALIEAQASIRLAGLPISDRDDDLYAAAIEGTLSGPLRDIVLARIRAELAQKADLCKPTVRNPDDVMRPPVEDGSE